MFAKFIRNPRIIKFYGGFSLETGRFDEIELPVNIEINNGNNNIKSTYSFHDNNVYALTPDADALKIGEAKHFRQAMNLALRDFDTSTRVGC